jgi:two-component system sensor histidine kinase KdpD
MSLNPIRNWAETHPFIFAPGLVAAATLLFLPGRDLLGKGHWALLYLLVISVVASVAGSRPSLVAAVVSFLTWDVFFLPPYNTFRVDDPKDWISLGVFLVVGVLIGLTSGRLREREALAVSQEREMALLNRLTGRLLATPGSLEMAETLCAEIEGVFSPRFTRFHLVESSGKTSLLFGMKAELEMDPLEEDFLDWVAKNRKGVASPAADPARAARPGGKGNPVPHSRLFPAVSRTDVFLPVLSSSGLEGILHIGERRSQAPYSWNEIQLLCAAANMAGTFLERCRLEQSARQAETLKEGDKLKSAIFSSLSHELKTPLSSLTATISGLLEGDLAWDLPHIRHELGSVKKDLDRLAHSIGALLDLSRLEAEAWKPDLQWVEPGEVLGGLLFRLDRVDRDRVRVDLPEGLPLVRVDFQQWGRLLMHILENALAYSPPGSPVVVGAGMTSSGLETWIADEGPGIPAEERKKVFTKFFRGSFSGLLPGGTGLGLPIANEIARVHGGRIRIEDNLPKGTRFVILLPSTHVRKAEG